MRSPHTPLALVFLVAMAAATQSPASAQTTARPEASAST